MKNRLMTFGLAGMMAMMSIVPAFAAPGSYGAAYGAAGVDSTEAVEYNNELGLEYNDAWTGVAQDDTEVLVSQASSFTVKIPKKITLAGKKGVENKADFEVTVNANVPGDLVINVAPNTASKTKLDGSATQENDFADGSGTFAMLEKAGVKKNITATITQADTTWTVADDNDGLGVEGITNAAHAGKVVVENLSSGEWSNNINFDIAATK